jgi:hypothetical protein
MLIYFLKGKLPWQGLKANDKRTKYGLILETKLKTPIATLCDGLPKEFAEFLVNFVISFSILFFYFLDFGIFREIFLIYGFYLLISFYLFKHTQDIVSDFISYYFIHSTNSHLFLFSFHFFSRFRYYSNIAVAFFFHKNRMLTSSRSFLLICISRGVTMSARFVQCVHLQYVCVCVCVCVVNILNSIVLCRDDVFCVSRTVYYESGIWLNTVT